MTNGDPNNNRYGVLAEKNALPTDENGAHQSSQPTNDPADVLDDTTPVPATAIRAAHHAQAAASAGGEAPPGSPTASMFEQCGFTPVKPSSKHAHPGTPSDRVAQAERGAAVATAMKKKNLETARAARDDAADPPMLTARKATSGDARFARGGLNSAGVNRAAAAAIRRARHHSPARAASMQAGPSRQPARTSREEAEFVQRASPPQPLTGEGPAVKNENIDAFVFQAIPAQFAQAKPVFYASDSDAEMGDDDDEDQGSGATSPTEDHQSRKRARANAFSAKSRPDPAAWTKSKGKGKAKAPESSPSSSSDDDEENGARGGHHGAAPMHPRHQQPPSPNAMSIVDSQRSTSSDSDLGSDADSSSDESDGGDVAAHTANQGISVNQPPPTEEQQEITSAQTPELANCPIVFLYHGDRSPVDGQTTRAWLVNASPAQLDALEKKDGLRFLLRVVGIIGMPLLQDVDEQIVDAHLIKNFLIAFPDTRVRVVRIKAPLDAPDDQQVIPFVYTIITTGDATPAIAFSRGKWYRFGNMLVEAADYEQVASKYVCSYVGLTLSRRRAKQRITEKWSGDAGVVSIANRYAQANGMPPAAAMNALVNKMRVVPYIAVKPRTPGVSVRHLVIYLKHDVPIEVLRRLRAATAGIVVDSLTHGRGKVWKGWNCLVCLSLAHPSGMCPAHELEGWAAIINMIINRARDARRANNAGPNGNGAGIGHHPNAANNAQRGGGQQGQRGGARGNGRGRGRGN